MNQDPSPDVTVLTNEPMSNSLEVVAATTAARSLTGDDSSDSLSQTFQVDSTFDLSMIYLGYEYDESADPSHSLVNIEIFEVDNVAAQELVPGTSIPVSYTHLTLPTIYSV